MLRLPKHFTTKKIFVTLVQCTASNTCVSSIPHEGKRDENVETNILKMLPDAGKIILTRFQ